MNSIIALKQKDLFTKRVLGMAGTAALLIAALFLAGCNTGVGYDVEEATSGRAVLSVQDDPGIYGTWRYDYDYVSGGVQYAGYEQYDISAGTLTYTYLDTINDEDYGMSFSGNIVNIVYNEDDDDTSGVIIIRYTSPPSDGTINYYNAVYFNNLTATTVQLGNAVNLSDYSSSEVEEEEDANANFTWGNVGNYIDWQYVNAQTRVP
jgi:predicted small secreted protein